MSARVVIGLLLLCSLALCGLGWWLQTHSQGEGTEFLLLAGGILSLFFILVLLVLAVLRRERNSRPKPMD